MTELATTLGAVLGGAVLGYGLHRLEQRAGRWWRRRHQRHNARLEKRGRRRWPDAVATREQFRAGRPHWPAGDGRTCCMCDRPVSDPVHYRDDPVRRQP